MEKEGEKVCPYISGYLPVHIIYDILDWLPEKTLSCLKCVSKRWRTLVNEYSYARLCRSIKSSSNTNRLVVFYGAECFDGPFNLYSYDLGLPESSAIELTLPNMKYEKPSVDGNMSVIGSCHGILCLRHRDREEIILLNPTDVMTFFELPKAPKFSKEGSTCERYGFGYDCKKEDFKLVKIVITAVNYTGDHRNHIRLLVYSLKTDSWRLAAEGMEDKSFRRPNCGVLVGNHLLHWTIWSIGEQAPGIVCFDLCKEKWVVEVPLPDYLQVRRRRQRQFACDTDVVNLVNLDGCLCLLIRLYGKFKGYIDVWVMKEYGVKESWVKLLDVSDKKVTRSLEDTPPIAYNSRDGHEILLCLGEEFGLYWYNLRDKSLRPAEKKVHSYDRQFHIC